MISNNDHNHQETSEKVSVNGFGDRTLESRQAINGISGAVGSKTLTLDEHCDKISKPDVTSNGSLKDSLKESPMDVGDLSLENEKELLGESLDTITSDVDDKVLERIRISTEPYGYVHT